jgi:hypothetical protein
MVVPPWLISYQIFYSYFKGNRIWLSSSKRPPTQSVIILSLHDLGNLFECSPWFIYVSKSVSRSSVQSPALSYLNSSRFMLLPIWNSQKASNSQWEKFIVPTTAYRPHESWIPTLFWADLLLLFLSFILCHPHSFPHCSSNKLSVLSCLIVLELLLPWYTWVTFTILQMLLSQWVQDH